MAWSPISLFVPQFEATTGLPASGYVLKAYQAGTSTNTPMATDSTGGTQVTSIALNADGYPSVSGNIIIPHIDRTFKLVLYPTQAAADANSGAKWTIDNLTPITNTQFANSVNSQTTTYTLQTSDEGKLIYYSGAGGVTLNLMAAATAGDGFSFLIKNNTSGNVTIDPNGAEQINGVTTLVLSSGQDAIVICTGTVWRAIFQNVVHLSGTETITGDKTFSGANTVEHADGSAATPSINFDSDTNTGVYRIGADSLGIATGGVNRATVGPGVQLGAPTGGDTGAGTINAASGVYDNGTRLYNGVGTNQTWQDMSGMGGRASGANIQNTTGKPIQVNVSTNDLGYTTGINTLLAYCDATATPTILVAAHKGGGDTASAGPARGSVSFIVPNNSYYRIDLTGYSVATWAELR